MCYRLIKSLLVAAISFHFSLTEGGRKRSQVGTRRPSASNAPLISDEFSFEVLSSAVQQVLNPSRETMSPWIKEDRLQPPSETALASTLLQFTPSRATSHAVPNLRAKSPLSSLETLADVVEKTEAFAKSGSQGQAEEVAFGTPTRVEQNSLGSFADRASDSVFALLHANDDLGIRDSSKNLRVLWSRALLNQAGAIKDPIAYQMLPSSSRDVISLLPRSGPAINFQEFIVSRTDFIDDAISSFVSSPTVRSLPDGVRPQVVLFGAGYDTRSMRLNELANFFEVDLEDVVEGKGKLQQRWKKEHGGPETTLPTRVAFNLNNAVDEKLTDVLEAAGLRRDLPTMFVWEAVLFYVQPEAIMAMYDDVLRFGGESIFCLVDSLKPAVTTSFLHDARAFFKKYGLEVLDHNSRWGGAVHFALTGTKGSQIASAIKKERGEMPFTYLPTSFEGGKEIQDHSKATFQNVWYAIGFSSQVGEGDVFATSLWGEPLLLYRDAEGSLIAAKDSIPHHSAPLSLDEISEHGNLETYAVEERDGLIYLWYSENVLTADVHKIPQMRKDIKTYTVDTVLDYNVDWQYIVENNLDSPHLFYLHDGSVPPMQSLNFTKERLPNLKLSYFEDDSGVGHYGKTVGGKPKIVRFDAPNIVRHGGTSSFSEEFHIIPAAPGRTRVLLRQHLPRGPILDTVLSIPGLSKILVPLVQLWNYHISLEDYSVMQGQAHNIDDLGAPHIVVGDLGDDIVQKFYKWKDAAVKNDGAVPYSPKWATQRPHEMYPPVNFDKYNGYLKVDQWFKRALGQETRWI